MRGIIPPFFMPDFSFRKRERLTSSKSISLLFQEGQSRSSFPFRILFSVREDGDIQARVAISVPKRLFKRAVDRNLLKRRIREAYRLNKEFFYTRLEEMNLKLNLVIQYQHKEILDFTSIEKGLQKVLEKLAKDLEGSA